MSDSNAGYPNLATSRICAAAIEKGTAVALDGSGELVLCTAPADIYGVAYQSYEIGDLGLAIREGGADAECVGAGIADGDPLTVDANGRFIPAGAAQVVAFALEEPGAALVGGRAKYMKIRLATVPIVVAPEA